MASKTEKFKYLDFQILIQSNGNNGEEVFNMELLLPPQEEVALDIIKERWDNKKDKISITNLVAELKKKGISLSHEKVRLMVESLWRKGELLIDVQGNERKIRPNHVTINSKSKPEDLRNFTINDKNGSPIQRIWASVYKDEKGQKYFALSESRWNGSWKTTSNIIIPPEAIDEFKEIIKFIESKVI